MLGNVVDYRCVIQPRGGGVKLGELPIAAVTSISWERRLDEFSTAEVTLSTQNCDCSVIQLADPIATELALFRANQQVWVGPITKFEMGRTSTTIQAQDLSAWLNWRVIHDDIVSTETVPVDLGTLAERIIDDGLLPDNPGISRVVQISGSTGIREYLAKDYLNSSGQLDELLRTDLDMVVVGRTLYVYQTETPQPFLPDLNDSHFLGDVRVIRDGIPVGTRVIVNGNESLWGIYPPLSEAGSARYGLKERVFNETSIIDQVSLTLAAKTRYELVKTPLTKISVPDGSRLSPDTPVNINDLIPGYRQKVTLTSLCFPISNTFRLQTVSVDVSSNNEEIKVSYVPLGSSLTGTV